MKFKIWKIKQEWHEIGVGGWSEWEQQFATHEKAERFLYRKFGNNSGEYFIWKNGRQNRHYEVYAKKDISKSLYANAKYEFIISAGEHTATRTNKIKYIMKGNLNGQHRNQYNQIAEFLRNCKR